MLQLFYFLFILSELFLNVAIQAKDAGGKSIALNGNSSMKVFNACAHTPEEKYYKSMGRIKRTCCLGHVLRPIVFDISPTSLRKCYGDEINKVDTELTDSLWSVFWCVVKRTFELEDTSPLTLDVFAEKSMQFYPPHIKTQILENIAKAGHKLDDAASPVERLKSIRETFYNVEESTCKGTPIDLSEKPKQGKKNCNAKLESLKGTGACCSKVTVPFNLMSLHGGKLNASVVEKIKNCTENLYKGVGTRKPKSKMGPVCVDTCYLLEANLVDEASLFSPPDIGALISKLMPTFLPEAIFNGITNTSTANIESATGPKNNWFPLRKSLTANVEKILKANQKGFKEIGDKAKAKALFTSCSVHSMLNRYLYVAIHKLCKSAGGAATNNQKAPAPST